MFKGKLSIPYSERLEVYDVAMKVFPNGHIEIKEYSKLLSRLKPGLELSNPPDTSGAYVPQLSEKKKDKKAANDLQPLTDENGEKTIRSNNLNRSFTQLIDYIEANDIWKSFITLTFEDNITDIDKANYEFSKYTQKVKRVFKDFRYIGVPEFQKRGAIHYHILTNVECGSSIIPKRETKNLWNPESKKTTQLKYYDLPYWSNGLSSAFDIVNDTDSNFRISKYMGKYFYKDIDNRLFGRKKILKSQGLKKPEIQRFLSDSEEFIRKKKNIDEIGLFEKPKIKGVISRREFAPDVIITNYYLKSM